MENNNEQPPVPPTPEKKKFNQYEVVERLKRDGIENAEAKEYLLGWIDQEQAEVTKIGTNKAILEFNVIWAQVYQEAGMIEKAREEFEKAAEQAERDHEGEIYEKIIDILNNL